MNVYNLLIIYINDMVFMDPTTLLQLTALGGCTLGATAAGLLPFWQKVRENEAAGQTPIVFNRMFLGTMVMAFVIGLAFAFMSFNTTIATLNPTASLLTVFIVSAVTAYGSNKALNTALTVDATKTTLVEQNAALVDEINLLKLKAASLQFPVKKELDLEPIALKSAALPKEMPVPPTTTLQTEVV